MKAILHYIGYILAFPFTFCANQFYTYEKRQNERRIANNAKSLSECYGITYRNNDIWIVCDDIAICKCDHGKTIDEVIFDINNHIKTNTQYHEAMV